MFSHAHLSDPLARFPLNNTTLLIHILIIHFTIYLTKKLCPDLAGRWSSRFGSEMFSFKFSDFFAMHRVSIDTMQLRLIDNKNFRSFIGKDDLKNEFLKTKMGNDFLTHLFTVWQDFVISLKPLQYTYGGPIIAVQVENEYARNCLKSFRTRPNFWVNFWIRNK